MGRQGPRGISSLSQARRGRQWRGELQDPVSLSAEGNFTCHLIPPLAPFSCAASPTLFRRKPPRLQGLESSGCDLFGNLTGSEFRVSMLEPSFQTAVCGPGSKFVTSLPRHKYNTEIDHWKTLRWGFSTSPMISGARHFRSVGGRPGHRRTWGSIPGLYPGNASQYHPPGCDSQECSQIWPSVPWGAKSQLPTPVEKHRLKAIWQKNFMSVRSNNKNIGPWSLRCLLISFSQ